MVFKYVGANSGEEALRVMKCFCEEHTLKATQPTTFNDPFEFKIAIDFEADETTIRKRFFLDREGSSAAEYEQWRAHHTKQSKWWINQETRKELLSRFGVCCLSDVDDNHLMWSHYASEHRGFCVGIDEAQLHGLKGLIGRGPVEYSEDAPRFRYYFDPPEMFEQRAVACKSSLWAYEREYRIVFDHSGIIHFPEAALKQIILGCRAYVALRMYADRRCEANGVEVFQMCEHFQDYRLQKQRIKKNVTNMSSFS